MNQAAMRITASLLLWYLLSAVSEEGGGSTEGLGPFTHPPLILCDSGCYHHVDISVPVKYYRLACLHISALSARSKTSLLSLVDAVACLLFILCLYVYVSNSKRFFPVLMAVFAQGRVRLPLCLLSVLWWSFVKLLASGKQMRKP